MPKNTQVRSSLAPGQVRGYAMDSDTTTDTLDMLGISASPRALRELMAAAQDASPDLLTTASTSTPIQFLQHFLPEPIRVVTQARTADRILGRDIAGKWSDEEVVATVLEPVGQSRPYGDKSDDGLIDWNPNFERRTIVRFGNAIEVSVLEEERSSAMRINSASEKRVASANSLAITLNTIAFNGYNDGTNRTYGILNDPNLPAYVNVASGVSGDTWALKTFDEITKDIITFMNALLVQSGANFDPYNDASCIAIAHDAIGSLSRVNSLGTTSVRQWIAETYPKARIEVAPQFTEAVSGDSVFYIIAESIGGRKVANQYVQDVYRMLGVERKAKGYLEAYSCATAGVLFAQPIGVVRGSGI